MRYIAVKYGLFTLQTEIRVADASKKLKVLKLLAKIKESMKEDK